MSHKILFLNIIQWTYKYLKKKTHYLKNWIKKEYFLNRIIFLIQFFKMINNNLEICK